MLEPGWKLVLPVWQSVTIALLAFLAVVGVSRLANRLEHRTAVEEAEEVRRWA